MRTAPTLCVLSAVMACVADSATAQKAFPPDHLYVADSTGSLLEFDETGAYVGILAEDVGAMAFGPDGLLYVGSASSIGIRALDADGDPVKPTFGGSVEPGYAVGMCFAAGGELCVQVTGLASAILVYDVAQQTLLRTLPADVFLTSPLLLAPDGHLVSTHHGTFEEAGTLLQLVEFDVSGGQLTPIDAGRLLAQAPSAVALGPDGNQYFAIADETEITVRSPAGIDTASIGISAGIEEPLDLRFGPDGQLRVASFGNDRIVVIDTTGNLLDTLGEGTPLDGPVALAFSPRRFAAKLTGKLVDAEGVSLSLKADGEATLAPGLLMLSIDDDAGDAADFASLFGATLVFAGHQAAGEDPKARRLVAASVLDATLDAGFAATDLVIKGKLDKEDGRFVPSKASGSFLRAAAGRLYTGKLSTGKKLD